MSHAWGQVISEDKEILGWFEYDGTSDTCITQIYKTVEEVNENWRSFKRSDCKCGRAPTSVIIYTSYGRGFYWHGEACVRCMAITGGISPYGNDWDEIGPEQTEGHPIPGYKVD
jgi:hypothetical protein